MSNIRIERVPIQEMGLWRIRADHLMLVFQQDPLDYGYYQDRWWVMEGTRDTNPDGSVTVGVDGSNGVTTLSEANGGKNEQDLLDAIGYPWWRGSRIIQSASPLSDWTAMASVAREIDAQGFPYFAFNFDFSPLPIANSSSVVASLLYYIGVDIAQNMPFTFFSFTIGTRTLLGTGGDDRLTLDQNFNTVLSGGGNDTLEGTQDASRTEKLYGGRGNDVFLWTEGSHVYHGGQPELDYSQDGIDAVDYTGIGIVTLTADAEEIPHLLPTFKAIHASGTDQLFSIEEIRWDNRSDQIILGDGVSIVDIKPFLDLKGQEEQGRGDWLDLSDRTSSIMVAPSDRPDIVLAGSRAGDGNFSDAEGIWGRSVEWLTATDFNDRVYAAPGMTGIEGGAGDDILSGRHVAPSTGNSPLDFDIELYGGEGSDTIVSGTGRSFAAGGQGADRFILSSPSAAGRNVEFVISDADALDRLFVPFNFLLPEYAVPVESAVFEGSELFPILGAVTPVIGGADFATLPQNPGPGPFNGSDAPGYFYSIGQVPLDGSWTGTWDGFVNITDQILFTRDGSDLLIHIYIGGEPFSPSYLTLEGQEFAYAPYDRTLSTEAVIRVVDFQEGMLGINFYELGEETPFPFPAGSGTPNAAKIWNTATFTQAGGTLLQAPLEAEPDTPVFDRPVDGETDNRELISGTEGDDILTVASVSSPAPGTFSSGSDLSGGGGNDELTGGGGRDTLDGGSGNDVMAGGGGNDHYFVDAAGDTVIEVSKGGVDTVIAAVDHALADNVEWLTLTGSAAQGIGNSGGNRLIGTSGANILRGLGGDDTILGGQGDDTIEGGNGNDTIVYQAGDGNDVILSTFGDLGYDVLRFVSLAPSDVRVFQSASGSDVVLRLADGSRVVLDSFFAGGSIDRVGFEDGTAWDNAFLLAAASASGLLSNDAPIAGADDGLFTDLRDVVIPRLELLGNDRDLDGDVIAITGAQSTTAGVTVSVTAGGDVRVQADPAFVGLAAFTYTISDGRGGEATAAANLTFVVNQAPVVSGPPLADLSTNAGDAFSFTIPLETFSDPDGHSLIYTVDLAEGSALPAWLSYDPNTRVLQGTPPAGTNANLAIRVTASDGSAAASTTFALAVLSLTPGVTLFGTRGSDILTGGVGDDTITGGRGNDTLNGLQGNDLFLVDGNGGFDRYDGGAGSDTIRGGQGDDLIGLRGNGALVSIETIDGGAGFDTIRLDGSANVLDLSGVNITNIELISGHGGNDQITGSFGDDVISGGGGSDILIGGAGNDTFLFSGAQGRDRFDGGAGLDTISGSAGNDVLHVENGTLDLVSIERIDAGAGFDVVRTGRGNDVLDLSGVNVTGLDQIEGGGGNDRLTGSSASEILVGGTGQDTFVFFGNFGHDTIADFQHQISPRRNGDVIDLSGLGFGSFLDVMANTQDVGSDSVIFTPDGTSSITLANIAKTLLQPDDFVV